MTSPGEQWRSKVPCIPVGDWIPGVVRSVGAVRTLEGPAAESASHAEARPIHHSQLWDHADSFQAHNL